jgi:hypothetical protein
MGIAALALVIVTAASPSFTPVAPGVSRLQLQGLDAELLRFDLARFRADVVVLDPPRTASAVREQTKAVAVVNGGFFDTEWRPLGLRISRGRTVVPLRPKVDWGVLMLRNGRAAIVHSREYQHGDDVETAVQVGPRLLAGGRPLKLKPQSARRTAVALDREGTMLTLVVTRGSVSAQALADALAALGFDAAMMLDGGPSTQLSAAVGPLQLELPGGYAVPDALVLQPR